LYEYLANSPFCHIINRMINTIPKSPLKPATLRAAGMLAMASALLTLPMFLLSIQFEGRHDDTARAILLVLQGAGSSIFVALAVVFRNFLNRNCAFNKADTIILAMIILNCVYAVASSATMFAPQGEEQFTSILVALIILLGIVQAGLGLRLFTLENGLGGMKRPYCWLNIITGVCLASLVLIAAGVIASAVADVMLGTIFLQEAKRLMLPSRTDTYA
jgi:hypothetical protein